MTSPNTSRDTATKHRAPRFMRGLLARGPLVSSAAVRVLGAFFLLASVSLGIRLVGTTEFGLAMLAVAIGQVVAFPIISLDRLVIRMTSTGRSDQTRRILRISTAYSVAIVLGTAAIVLWALQHSPQTPLFVLVAACGLVAVTTCQLIVRQGVNRAQGRLGWGQIPNEVIRPIALIAGFAVSSRMGGDSTGGIAVLVGYSVTLLVIMVAPTALPQGTSTVGQSTQTSRDLHKPMIALIVIAAAAMLVERGLTVGLGALASPDEVTRYTIVLRVIQLAMFAQMFGIFFYSPHIARLHSLGPEGRVRAIQRVRNIRLLGLAAAVPTAIVCLFFPEVVAAIMGTSFDLHQELKWTAFAVIARTIAGTTQAYLTMTGHEHVVATSSAVAVLAGCIALALIAPLTAATATATAAINYAFWALGMIAWCKIKLGRLI